MQLKIQNSEIKRGWPFGKIFVGASYRLELSEQEVALINQQSLWNHVLLKWELYDDNPAHAGYYLNRATIKRHPLDILTPVYETTMTVSRLYEDGFLFARDTTGALREYEDQLVSNIASLNEHLKALSERAASGNITGKDRAVKF
jgi:hypothetical protein